MINNLSCFSANTAKPARLPPGPKGPGFRPVPSYDWNLDKSLLSQLPLSKEDVESIINKMYKIVEVPEFIRRGDAWDKAGRPRGKAGDRFDKDWNKKENKRKLKNNS